MLDRRFCDCSDIACTCSAVGSYRHWARLVPHQCQGPMPRHWASTTSTDMYHTIKLMMIMVNGLPLLYCHLRLPLLLWVNITSGAQCHCKGHSCHGNLLRQKDKVHSRGVQRRSYITQWHSDIRQCQWTITSRLRSAMHQWLLRLNERLLYGIVVTFGATRLQDLLSLNGL